MKILFMEKKLRTDKLGMLYLARILKDAGHSVELLQSDIDDVYEYMNVEKPDFVMYSVMSGDHKWFLDYNRLLKSYFEFTSVMGGPHFTFFPEQGLDDVDVDLVVQGPGEGVILDVVENSSIDKLIRGYLPNVNELSHPDRSILYKYDEFGKARMKRFIAGRYCLYSCTYCFNHLFKKIYKDEKPQFFQRVSPEKMIDEIKKVRDQYGLELIYFNDDDLAADRGWLLEFCDRNKRELGLEFCGSIRADSVDHTLIEIMKNAGCTFMNIALESANPKTQRFLRRGSITNEQIIDATTYCEEVGIKIRLQNMIGLPVEDPLADAIETLEMNQRINPTDSWAAIFQPFPKTVIWQHCIDKGLMTKDTPAQAFYEHTPLNIKDADKINRLHKWWFFAIKYKWPIDLVEILLDTPLSKEQEEKIQEYRWNVAKKLLYEM